MREYDYYLFDADGTLFDTAELIYRCFVHTAGKTGHVAPTRRQVLSHIGLTLRDQMQVYFGSLTDQQFEQFRATHMEYQLSVYRDFLALCDHTKDALELLKKWKKPCAVVSSRMRTTLDLFLKETGIFDYFDVLVTPEITSKHKPHPEPALKALSLLGATAASQAIFIGDASFDIECGSRAGTATALVAWSASDRADMPVMPTYLLSDMRELCTITE